MFCLMFWYKILKNMDFFSQNSELDNTGTTEEPLIAGWVRGKFKN